MKYDLAMDSVLLRQMRGGTNPFLRGFPGSEETALALESLFEKVCWNQQKKEPGTCSTCKTNFRSKIRVLIFDK